MNDDVETNLDEFYRGFDAPAHRIEKRWEPGTRRLAPVRPPSIGPWLAAVGAVAAAVILVVALRSGDAPPRQESAKREREKEGEREREKQKEPKRETEPKNEPKKEPTPEPVKPVPKEPDLVVPEPKMPKPDEPKPQPPRPKDPEPAPTKPADPEPEPARAVLTLKEADGSFELAGRKLTGKQKDLKIAAGDKLKATAVTKLTLADNRFLLLGPKATVTVTPDEKRLVIAIEAGDVLAELVGAGVSVHFVTKNCEIDHVGTVFSIRVDEKRTLVVVEEGRVECTNAKGKIALGAGQQAVAGDDLVAQTADFRTFAWAKGHRAAERTRFAEDFSKVGSWEAEVANGVAKSVPDPDWCAGKIKLESNDPLFTVPVKGKMTIVCKADRAATLVIQMHCTDPKVNFRREIAVSRGNAWQTITIDMDEFAVKATREKLPAGAVISELYLMYAEAGDKATLWVDSITVTETR